MKDNRAILVEMLKTMQVPQNRLVLAQTNLQWLQRNLGVYNHRHPKFGDAMGRIKQELVAL